MMSFSFGFPQNYSVSNIPSYHSTVSPNELMFRAQSSNSLLPSINNFIQLPPLFNIPSVPKLEPVTQYQAPISTVPIQQTHMQVSPVEPMKQQQEPENDEDDERIAYLLTTLSQPSTSPSSSPKTTSQPNSPSFTTTPRGKRATRNSSKSESDVDAKEQDSSSEEGSEFDETFVEFAPKRRRLPTPTVQPEVLSDSDDSSISNVTPASPSNNNNEPSSPTPSTKKASKKSNRAKYNDDLWFQHFEELKKFKKKNGHTNVTQSHKGSKTLANWVHNQRKNQGKNMPGNRRKLLEEIGFEFNRAYAAVTFNKKKKGESDAQNESSVETNL